MTLNISSLVPFGSDTLPSCIKPWGPINGMVKKVDGRTVYQYHPSDALNMRERNTENYAEDQYLYSVNSLYFRADELNRKDNRNSILFLGCSHTFGIGLSDEDCYASIVSKQLNLKNWNHGVGGLDAGSAVLIFRQILNANYIPKYAFILWPEWTRKLILIKDPKEMVGLLKANLSSYTDQFGVESFINKIATDNNLDWNKLLYVFYGGGAGTQYDKEKHIALMKKCWNGIADHQAITDFIHYRNQFKDLCDKHNIIGIEAHVSPAYTFFNRFMFGDDNIIKLDRHFQNCKEDYARDNQHLGPISNKLWADEILKHIPIND